MPMDHATVQLVPIHPYLVAEHWKRLTRKYPNVPEFERSQECLRRDSNLGSPANPFVAGSGNLW